MFTPFTHGNFFNYAYNLSCTRFVSKADKNEIQKLKSVAQVAKLTFVSIFIL